MSSPPETDADGEGTKPHNGREHNVLDHQGPEALTRFQYDCLLEIGATAPVIGLDIKRALEDYYGEEVHHGRLYPNLDSLVDAGLIEKREADGRSNHYTLTEDGQRVVRDRVAHVTERLDRLDAREGEDLDEAHECGTPLVRVADDDSANPQDGDAIVCPACLETVRVEEADP